MLLGTINSPASLKSLAVDELKELAEEMRGYLISVLSITLLSCTQKEPFIKY